MTRLTYEQRQNFQRGARLNAGSIKLYGLSYLRSLYRSCQSGQQYGLYSGYSP